MTSEQLPAILAALEEKLEDFKELEDYDELKMPDIGVNQMILFDTLIDLTKQIIQRDYQLDILKDAMQRFFTVFEEMAEAGFPQPAEETIDNLRNVYHSLLYA